MGAACKASKAARLASSGSAPPVRDDLAETMPATHAAQRRPKQSEGGAATVAASNPQHLRQHQRPLREVSFSSNSSYGRGAVMPLNETGDDSQLLLDDSAADGLTGRSFNNENDAATAAAAAGLGHHDYHDHHDYADDADNAGDADNANDVDNACEPHRFSVGCLKADAD